MSGTLKTMGTLESQVEEFDNYVRSIEENYINGKKKQFNKKVKEDPLEVGEMVHVFRHGRKGFRRKYFYRFPDKVIVQKHMGGPTYLCKTIDGESHTFHRKDLRRVFRGINTYGGDTEKISLGYDRKT